MASTTKQWPDPPLWMSVNLSTPPPPDRVERVEEAERERERERERAASPLAASAAAAEGTVLSTSSLSEAPAARNSRSRLLDAVARRQNMNAVDLAALSVDYDDQRMLLGVGSAGSVYRATYYGEPVAVKCIRLPAPPRELRSDPEAVAERRRKLRGFARTMRRYEAVQHPNIVRLLGTSVSVDPDALDAVIVLEMMYGGSLADSLATLKRTGKQLDPASIVRIAVQVAGALRILHTQALAWGGAKPENVLFTERVNPATGGFPDTARASITDLGLADAVAGHLQTDSICDTSTTNNGLTSFAFKAPEAFMDDSEVSTKQMQTRDIYSLGSIIYYMTTLRVPWEGMKMSAIFSAKSSPKWPVEGDIDHRTDIPHEIVQLVMDCWHSDPELRPTANDVFARLVKCRNTLDRSVEPIHQHQTSIDDSTDAAALTTKSSQSSASTAVGISPPPGEEFVDDVQRVNSTRAFNPRTSPLTSPDHSRKNSAMSAAGAGAGPSTRPVPPQAVQEQLSKLPVTSPLTAPVPHPDRQQQATIESSIETEAVESLFKRSIENDDMRLDLPSSVSKSDRAKNNELNLFESGDTSASQLLHRHQQQQPRLDETTVFGNQEFPDALARAALKFQNKVGSGYGAHPESVASNSASADGMSNAGSQALSSKTISGFNLFESVGPNASAAAVAASMKRKRSLQIHAVLERAGAAFLELQRREGLANSTPPSQKRREVKNKAEEKARKRTEEQAILKLNTMKNEERYSDILLILREHAEFELVTKAGLDVLEMAVSLQGVYVDLCEEGAIDILHGAVSMFGEHNVELCRSFCRIATALAVWRNTKVDHRLRAAGIPSELVTLITHHQGDVSLLTVACTALGTIARSSEESRNAVATLGGPLAVYRAMTRNLATYKDVDLMRAALAAVQSIANSNELASNTLVQVAGLDAVSHAAEVFAGFALEEDILAALEAFSFYNDGRKALITSGGLHALSALMLRRRDVPFSERCCVFIRSVAQWKDPRCEAAMLESSIAERAVMTVRLSERYPGDEGGRLAFYASQAVMYLASFGAGTRTRLRMTGGLDAVINLLRTRPANARVVTMATNALVELMKGDIESQAEAERLGAVKLLIMAAKRFENESSVYGAVSLTLGYFAGMRKGRIAPSDPLHAYSRFAAGNQQPARRRWLFGNGNANANAVNNVNPNANGR